jgi:L-seryl-tRNA(Ser) seleniumtransferase
MDILRTTYLRSLPSVDEASKHPSLAALNEALPQDLINDTIREVIDETRALILDGQMPSPHFSVEEECAARLHAFLQPSLRKVINATGVVLHTNVGRSPLAPQAIEAVVNAAEGYSTLEYNTDAMARGSRHSHYEQLVCKLTGAEAALAVNNNAAAVYMILSEFASGREALVSRGEEVEIGGSFRIPDIMSYSGVTMVEVGATNKTHLYDYERALNSNTALMLKVHTSNYQVVGFSESVSAKELCALAQTENERRAACAGEGVLASPVLVYEDLGSGALVPLSAGDGESEPTVADALKSGCDLVSFSGDKLLGGPQAGLIVGRKELIDRLKKNPLARVCRLDKMTLAALEATLRLYLNPAKAQNEIPTLHMLTMSAAEVRARCEQLACALEPTVVAQPALTLSLEEGVSSAGGGSLPVKTIPTTLVTLTFGEGAPATAEQCSRFLIQENEIPIVCRIRENTLSFDARTLNTPKEIAEVAAGIARFFTAHDAR